jgi:hypothetical protein
MPPKKADKPTTRSGREDPAARERRVSLILSVGAILTLVALYYGHELLVVPRLRLNQLHLHSLQDRVTYALRLQLPGLLALLISVLHVGSIRYSGGQKLSDNDSRLKLARRILTNTVEQLLLSAGSQIILATYLPEDRLKILPLIAVTFFVGRLTFLIGFLYAPHFRSFGFTLTIVPTIGALGYDLYFMLTLGLVSRLSSPSVRS